MIRNGREGNNMGLTTGLKKLDKLTYGIQRSWLTVVAGGSGSGLKILDKIKACIENPYISKNNNKIYYSEIFYPINKPF